MASEASFDHSDHLDRLRHAATELRVAGRTELAGAVERAILIHIEFQSRVATARREVKRIGDAIDRLQNIKQTLEDYVTRAAGPWIGPDLFPGSL